MSDRRLTRMPYKQRRERARLDALLDAVLIGHVAFVSAHGEPQVLPVAVARWGDELVWHGSTGSGWLGSLGHGRVSVCVTSVEALVVGRSRFENSFWYSSAVVYGTPRRLEGDEAIAALDALTEHVLPGRVAETRYSSRKELAATVAFAVPLTDWILKESREWPDDPEDDRQTDVWAGVVPMSRLYGDPMPAPDLRTGVPLPASCERLLHAEAHQPVKASTAAITTTPAFPQ